jgi:Subtilase family
MKSRLWWLGGLLLALLWSTPVSAQTGVIVRTTNLPALQALCVLPATCTIVEPVDGTLGQVFLITTPLPLQNILNLLGGLAGFVDAEVDQVLNLVNAVNLVPSPLPAELMSDRTPVPYPANSTTTVWNSYANQPAASVVGVQNAQSQFNVTGTGIVADIDTGVDPNHPALQPVLLQGYDFTRNQPGGSEMNDLAPSFPQPSPCDSTTCPSAIQVNQSSAAILDQSSAAILDTNTQYSAFGHGTMVMGVIHLVAPTAQLLPLKAFKSDGTANLSDILRAIYYAAQNNANVINMSFDTLTASTELQDALNYANQLGLIEVASAGNDGVQEIVYPASLQSDVMGVASVGSTSLTDNTRSSFSNFGDAIVWVAAPGEEIITTYPFSTYAAGWGTSFSAPFVSGGAALLQNLTTPLAQSGAATAIANADPLTSPGMGHGRLDLVPALQSLSGVSGSPDFAVSAAPSTTTLSAGGTATYTVTATPEHGFNQPVTWNCTGAPAGTSCTVSPQTVNLDGTHTATATVTLQTTAASLELPTPGFPHAAPPVDLWLWCAVWLAILAALCMCRSISAGYRSARGLAGAATLLAVVIFAHACGGGSGMGSAPGPPSPPPPSSPALSSVAVAPTTVNGGASSTGTITLSAAAPSGGAIVALSSSTSSVTVPASVTVAAGATSATFTVSTSLVTAATAATITASYGGSTKTALLTVNPASAGTPPGTYSITITGSSGSLSHAATVQLIVN